MNPATPPPVTADRARLAGLLTQDTLDVRIDRLVEGGLGFGRVEGFALLVPRAAPGDLLRVKLTDRKRDYARAEIVEVLEAGPDRIEARCSVYSRCGGCDLQHIRVERQAELKAAAAGETLRRLGGVDCAGAEVVSGDPFGYRSRAQLQVRGRGNELDVGFFERGTNELVATLECPVLVDGLESRLGPILQSLRGESEELLQQQSVSIAASESDEESAADVDHPIPTRLDLLLGDGDELTTAPKTESLPHRPVVRRVGDFDYELDARCFFQGHSSLVGQLVDLAVGDGTDETVFELHAGVGLFSMPLARANGHVYAVESDRIAGRYLARNAKRNRLDNVTVAPSSAEHFLKQLLSDAQRAATGAGHAPPRAERWFVDPPRTGLSKELVRCACRLRPKRITYVSCQPATLARDLKMLHRFYTVRELTFLDLFPQTAHIETVVQLVARDEPLPAPAAPPREGKQRTRRGSPRVRSSKRDGRGRDRQGVKRDPGAGSRRPRHNKDEADARRGRRGGASGTVNKDRDPVRACKNFGGGWSKKEASDAGRGSTPRVPRRGRAADRRPERPPLERRDRRSEKARRQTKSQEDSPPNRPAADDPWANARVGGRRGRRKDSGGEGSDGES